jgi:hypothetical protein
MTVTAIFRWVVALFMIMAGGAEVVTGVRHEFFGITTSRALVFTWSSVLIGLCYAASGVLVLTRGRTLAVFALVLLGLDFFGRIALVVAGLYPLDTQRNVLGIVAGTVLVAAMAVYVWATRLRVTRRRRGSR